MKSQGWEREREKEREREERHQSVCIYGVSWAFSSPAAIPSLLAAAGMVYIETWNVS